jgi:hypothetical protein
MIEVFKTNVIDFREAAEIMSQIHRSLSHCVANFDLDDCDHILRVQGIRGEADIFIITGLMRRCGYEATVLPDDFEIFDAEVLTIEGEWHN